MKLSLLKQWCFSQSTTKALLQQRRTVSNAPPVIAQSWSSVQEERRVMTAQFTAQEPHTSAVATQRHARLTNAITALRQLEQWRTAGFSFLIPSLKLFALTQGSTPTNARFLLIPTTFLNRVFRMRLKRSKGRFFRAASDRRESALIPATSPTFQKKQEKCLTTQVFRIAKLLQAIRLTKT